MLTSYLYLKMIHILGVTIFIGNIIVTGWWKLMADRTLSPSVIAFAQRQVTVTDYIFTFGGILLTLIGGLGNVWINGIDPLTPWILKGASIFLLSGLIWVAVLIPIQYKQAKMAKKFEVDNEIPQEYWRLNNLWYIWGIINIIIPVSIIYWMVGKPT